MVWYLLAENTITLILVVLVAAPDHEIILERIAVSVCSLP